MSNIAINHQKVLEVLTSLNIETTHRSKVGRPPKMSDIEVVAFSLTAEYMSIDSENNLFKNIDDTHIKNL